MAEPLFELQNRFAGFIRNPEQLSPPDNIESRRMAIYRDLFFNNIDDTLSNAFPVMRELFESSRWHAMVRDFMVRHRCKTPLLYEVSREFLDYLASERNAADDPPFLYELAHYEWVELALSVARTPFQRDGSITDSLAQSYCRSQLAWLLRYDYPVHQICKEFQPQEPAEQPLFFLVYRNEMDDVKFSQLNLISARLLELLSNGIQAKQAARQIAQELNHPDARQVLNSANDLIDDWRQKGVLIKQ